MQIKDAEQFKQMLEDFKQDQKSLSTHPETKLFYPKETKNTKIFTDEQLKEKNNKADIFYSSVHFRNIFLGAGLLMLLGNGLMHLVKAPIMENIVMQKVVPAMLIYSGVVLTSFALFYVTPLLMLDKRNFQLTYRSPYEKIAPTHQKVKK